MSLVDGGPERVSMELSLGLEKKPKKIWTRFLDGQYNYKPEKRDSNSNYRGLDLPWTSHHLDLIVVELWCCCTTTLLLTW